MSFHLLTHYLPSIPQSGAREYCNSCFTTPPLLDWAFVPAFMEELDGHCLIGSSRASPQGLQGQGICLCNVSSPYPCLLQRSSAYYKPVPNHSGVSQGLQRQHGEASFPTLA